MAKRKEILSIVRKLSKSIKKDLKKAISKASKLDITLNRIDEHSMFEEKLLRLIDAFEDAPSIVREFLKTKNR